WHPLARDLYRALDYPLWRESGHNAVKQIGEMNPDRLRVAASDPGFLELYDSVLAAFDADMAARETWFQRSYPNALSGPVAYFSMEFAIHHSLPIYAGGLGVLAGDFCKEASDLGLPMVGLGFMYPQGYFRQRISEDGWQEEIYQQLNYSEVPAQPIDGIGRPKPVTQVKLGDRTVFIGAWEVRVGRNPLYLLDTDIEENSPPDRDLCARLYIADPDLRLQQEIVLGIGGVRALQALGVQPAIWHANEGHPAFMMVERARQEVASGLSFEEAIEKVRRSTVFTTHTPVPAGHDVFPVQLIDKHLGSYFEGELAPLGIKREQFLAMGRQGGTQDEAFNMTVLALRMAGRSNAVSELHRLVSRRMWRVLWPELPEAQIPIVHITNGIHIPTWIAPEIDQLLNKYLGQNWVERQDDQSMWNTIHDIPDEELWAVCLTMKRKLMHNILERAQERWSEGGVAPQHVLAIGALLDHDVLTVGFVRRFAQYKRPALVFYDIDRLKRIVKDRWRPVQIIFAGKSHPADFESKRLLREAYALATDRDFQGRIAFVEDYDLHLAHYLAHGMDVWLNVPRRLQEACGTSGMKASLNGVPHLSVPDGWWHEGYNGANGWVIGDERPFPSSTEEDTADAEALYRLLEEEIVPLYYERDRNNVPHGWVRVVKEAIRSCAPLFSARRMVKEYTEKLYLPSAGNLPPR
ncbi:MAG: alpha-glucan family phosphorylase, partial [Chloroflexi bacterium]|nr:alpha-glucan family phosphorylase [Chloroflexota bacterium]